MPTYYIKNQMIIDWFGAEPPETLDADYAASGHTRVDDPGNYSSETHTYVDGAFVPIPEPSAAEALAAAQEIGLKRLSNHFQNIVDNMSPANRYPQFERDSQEKQVAWAQAYTTDTVAQARLEALAAPVGQTVSELAAAILANKDAWDAMQAQLIGVMRPYRNAISAATSEAEIQAILNGLPTAADIQAAMAGGE